MDYVEFLRYQTERFPEEIRLDEEDGRRWLALYDAAATGDAGGLSAALARLRERR